MVEQELTKEELEAFNETWGIKEPSQKKDSSTLSYVGILKKILKESFAKKKKTS